MGAGVTKIYHEGPIEYKYSDSLNILLQRLYFIHAEENAEQLEKIVDTPKGTEYIIRFVSCLPKGVFKTGSVVLNNLLNKLGNVMPEIQLPGYKICGPSTKLDKRLARGDEPINKLDAGCKQHDIFYRVHSDTKERHIAGKELEKSAKERITRVMRVLAKKLIPRW